MNQPLTQTIERDEDGRYWLTALGREPQEMTAEEAASLIEAEDRSSASKDALTCCVCGADIDPDSGDYECITTDHGPDHACTGCDYAGDEE